MAKSKKKDDRFATMFGLAVQLAKVEEADALLVWLDQPANWEQLKKIAGKTPVLVAADDERSLIGAAEFGLDVVALRMDGTPVHDRLGRALLQSISDEILAPGAGVVAVYSSFELQKTDSVSFIRLDEHLGRLTVRDLRQLVTRVPLDTLKSVVDLAVDIGREGREGKPVGTLFVVGDSRTVMSKSSPSGFDPVKGYNRKERNLRDGRVREGIKEIAQLDGAFVVSSDGTIEGACRIIDSAGTGITLSKGLGSRHWAAAAITKKTNSIAVAVSESSGTVRLFQNGEVALRIEPFRRAMIWKDFESELPASIASD